VSLGEAKAKKTSKNRTVRLLGPLNADHAEWRLAAGHPGDEALVFLAAQGAAWTRAGLSVVAPAGVRAGAHGGGRREGAPL
jgi:hypothetical protein